MTDCFDGLLAGNAGYRQCFDPGAHTPPPKPSLVMVTCMDSRIDPLAIFGLQTGEAFVIRNAGARIDDDALRSIVMAVDLMGVRNIVVMHHTQCAMCSAAPGSLSDRVQQATGVTVTLELGGFDDHVRILTEDIERMRASDLLPDEFGLQLAGFMYAVEDGTVTRVV